MTTQSRPAEDDTTAELSDTSSRRGRVLRRIGVGFLVAIVLAAAFDLLGPRVGEKTVTGAGYTLHLEYPQITRAGQPMPLHVSVESAAGFDKTVQVRFCDELFNDLDFQNWYPNPSAESTVPPWIVYEFDAPPTGDVLEISLDGRTAPGQFGELDDCQVAVLEDDEAVLTASFTVWRMP